MKGLDTLPSELATNFEFPSADGEVSVAKGLVVQFTPTEDLEETSNSEVVMTDWHIQQIIDVANDFSCKKTYGRIHSHKIAPLQFHLHTPSEHTIDGKQYPMELHIVNWAPGAPQCLYQEEGTIENCIAVVGILYTIEDEENAEDDEELTRLVESITFPKEKDVGVKASVDL